MTLPDLGSWLASHGPNATFSLEHEMVRALQAELKRLEQSSDRLRKQNNKLRKRITRLKAGEPDPGDTDLAGETIDAEPGAS